MTSPDDVEAVLRDAGTQWRAGQPSPLEPDPTALARPARSPAWVPLAAVAGVLAVVAAVAVPLAMRAGNSSGGDTIAATTPTDIHEWLLPADTGSGVAVRAVGTLFRAGTGPILLCASVFVTADLPASSAGCDPIAVPVAGVDPALLTHTTTGGQAFSEQRAVTGTYHGGKLAVASVSPAPSAPSVGNEEPPVPCAAPDGGWPLGEGLPAEDHGDSLNSLIENVRAHPDRYTDIWEGHPDGLGSAENSGMPTRMVYVVGTTGDVGAARATLSAIYPGNLCVHKVRYTQKDLDDAANQLRSINATPIVTDVGVIENRVKVRVIALDATTLGALGSVDQAALQIEEPLLLPAS